MPRPSFRFSLRTLAVVVALLAILLAWIARERAQSHREFQMTEQLRANTRQLEFGGPYDDEYFPSEYQTWWRTQLHNLLGSRVRYMSLRNPSASQIAALQELKNLRTLDGLARKMSPLKILPR